MSQQSDHDLIIEMASDVKHIKNALPRYVTQDEFKPVKAIAFGFAGIVLVAVVGAILKLIIQGAA